MTHVLTYTLSPASAIEHLRGEIADARRVHPDVLQLTVLDQDGDRWVFTTQDATWSPDDPEALHGRRIVDGSLAASDDGLRLVLSYQVAFML